MPAVTLKDRQKINHELKTLGFGALEDRNLYAQIATLYPTHEAFRGLLMSTAPAERRKAYECLKPHLSFTPRSLEDYEMEVKQRAEREQWDVWDGSAFPKPFKPGEIKSEEHRLAEAATEAIKLSEAKGFLTLECVRCTREQGYSGKTRKAAFKDAHRDGWRASEHPPEMLCPACAPKTIVQ